MFALFGEGLVTALFPCSLVLAVPGIAVAAGGRHRAATATGAFLVGLFASSWFRFSDTSGAWPSLVTGSVFILAALAVATGGRWSPTVAIAGAGVASGAGAAALWRPCVGVEFGEVLTNVAAPGVGGGFDLAVYLVGVMTPVIALTAVVHAVPAAWVERASKQLIWFGGATLTLIGVATIAGLDDRLINRLYELSSF